MTEVRLYKNPLKTLRIFALTIPFIVIGIWQIKNNENSGWFTVLFFGLGIPVGLFQLLDRRPQIIINENSIWDRTTNQGEVLWDQIQGAYPLKISRQKFISLVVDDSFVFKMRQPKWAAKLNDALEAQNLNLLIGPLKIHENTMTNFILEMIETDKNNRHTIIEKYFLGNNN